MSILTNRTVKLASLNIRTEKNGEEPVLAADLKLSFATENAVLDDLAPGLRAALFKPADAAGEAQQLFADSTPLPIRRFPSLEPIRFGTREEGRQAKIDYGIANDSAIQLASVSIDRWTASLLEGGSVELTCRLQCNPDPDQIGKLSGLLEHEITVTVTKAEAGAQPDLPEASADPAAATKRSRKKKGATGDDDGGQAFPGAIDGTKSLNPETADA